MQRTDLTDLRADREDALRRRRERARNSIPRRDALVARCRDDDRAPVEAEAILDAAYLHDRVEHPEVRRKVHECGRGRSAGPLRRGP